MKASVAVLASWLSSCATGCLQVTSCEGGGTGNRPEGRVAFAPLPARGGGALTNPWSNGEPRILKDRSPGTAGELFGFGWSDKLYLFKSADRGGSWTFVDPPGGEVVGTSQPLCAAQDSPGQVHLLFKNGPAGRVEYARLAPIHDQGAISSFRVEVQGVELPGGYNTNGDVRATLQVVLEQSGGESLVFEVNDNSAPATFRVQMGQATTLRPAASGDFVSLSGAPGTTEVFSSAEFNNHDHAATFAQLRETGDLWVFWGPVDAELGAQDDTYTTRLRLSPSGPRAWSVGAPVQMVTSDAVASPEVLSVFGTRRFVWLLYLDPRDGLSIDRVDGSGTYRHAVVRSPDPAPHRNGWGVLSVSDDETRLWAIWSTLSREGPGVQDRTMQGYFDGAAWATFEDPVAGDCWGMGGTLGWSEGVVATRVDEETFGIALSAIHGGEPAR